MKGKLGFLLVALLVTLFLVTAHDAYADHDDIVVLVNTGNGPVLRILDLNGSLRARKFVLNDTFTKLHIDPVVEVGPGSGHERIAVCGNSATEGPGIELWERDLPRRPVFSIRVLNRNFNDVHCSGIDLTGDRADEIAVIDHIIGPQGPVFHIQVYDQTGNLLFGGPLGKPNVDADFIVCFNDECSD